MKSKDRMNREESTARAFAWNFDLGLDEFVFVGHWISRTIDTARTVIQMQVMPDCFDVPCAFAFKKVTTLTALCRDSTVRSHVAECDGRINRPINRTRWEVSTVHGFAAANRYSTAEVRSSFTALRRRSRDLSTLIYQTEKRVATERCPIFLATPHNASVLSRSRHHRDSTRPQTQPQAPKFRSPASHGFSTRWRDGPKVNLRLCNRTRRAPGWKQPAEDPNVPRTPRP